jgi:hypothetical protein
MGQIYKNGLVNLAATAAMDSDGGLFNERDPLLVQPLGVVTKWPLDTEAMRDIGPCYLWDDTLWRESILQAPLNKRGWVLQERLLSPRIVHFSTDQVFWQCKYQLACETFPGGLKHRSGEITNNIFVTTLERTRNACRNSLWGELRGPWSDSRSESLLDSVHEEWWKTIEQYSSCCLSKDEDILVAIQGLANEMQETVKDNYLAGLWQSRLEEGLMWYTQDGKPIRCRPWRAPTWSWASIKGKVYRSTKPARTHQNEKYFQLITFDAFKFHTTGADNASTGQLTSAQISIKGFIFEGIADLGEPIDGRHETEDGKFCTLEGHGPRTRVLKVHLDKISLKGEVSIDDFETLESLVKSNTSKVLCMPLTATAYPSDSVELRGLVIECSETLPEQYQRIGIFTVNSEKKVMDLQTLMWGSIFGNMATVTLV